jgi:hypothetical protein
MQLLQQGGLFINEQNTYEPNSLYSLGDVINILNTHAIYAKPSVATTSVHRSVHYHTIIPDIL